MKFKFTNTQLQILRNFAKINPSQIISPTKFGAIEPSNSIVGVYEFDEPFDFDEFGIYDVPVFLQSIDAFDSPELEIKKDRVIISEGSARIQFFTTPIDLLKKSIVPDIETKFTQIDCEIDFDLSADKLATIQKTAQILKAKYLFIESDDDVIRLTVTPDTLESSSNCFEVVIRDNIRSNELGDEKLKLPLSELRVLPGDYTIKGSTKKITKWSCFNGVVYYVGCKVED